MPFQVFVNGTDNMCPNYIWGFGNLASKWGALNNSQDETLTDTFAWLYGIVNAANTIIDRAAKMGIPAEDIIIDPLVMTVGHNSNAALVTLKTIELVRKEYGVNISLGASNVSFGLPDRHAVNSAFLALAIQTGITTAITDPIKLGNSIKAIDLLLGRDGNSIRYLKYFRATEKLKVEESAVRV